MRVCWLPLLLFTAALAQTTPPPATGEPARMAGKVTNSLTGEPVLRAHVAVRATGGRQGQSPQTYGALTNGEGKFSIASLPPGAYVVSVDRVGFVPQPSAGGKAINFTLGAGEKRDDVALTLVPAGAITGRVLDAAGEPMQGITVFVEGTDRNGLTTVTDDAGKFRLGGLRPGKYRVKAAPQVLPFPPETRTDGTQETHYATTYYPNSLSTKAAQRVEVKAGADAAGTDIRLVSPPVIRVSGKVVGLPRDFKNVFVAAQQIKENGSNSESAGNVKPDGTFEIWNLEPGKYTLAAVSSERPGPNLQSSPLDIEVTTGNLDHLELQMVAAFDIGGQLRFEDDQARQAPQPPVRAGQTAPPPPAPRPLKVHLQEEGGTESQTVEVGADDSFQVEKLQPGRYRVALFGGSGFVRAVRAGSTEVEGDTLDARAGAPGPVTVMVSSNFGGISGTVIDFKGPVAGATVVLVKEPMVVRQMQSDANGGYHFDSVPPGKYSLIAMEEGATVPRSAFDLEDYEDSAEHIDLRAGDKIGKDLRQRPAGK